MIRFLKVVFVHVLFWVIVCVWAMARNKGDYKADLLLASFYFTLLCIPVVYLLFGIVVRWFNTVGPKWKCYGAMGLLYILSIPYAYVFIYTILPSVGVYFFNPKGVFGWLAFIGSITVEFVIFLLITVLLVLIKKYGAMLIEFVNMKVAAKAAGFQYQLKGHVDGKLLSFVANVEAENGNWENYELISKMQDIKAYARRVHQHGMALVTLQEEWEMVVKMVESIHIREGKSNLIRLEIKGEWNKQMIPAFTLLTFIENIDEYAYFTQDDCALVVLELNEDGFSYYSRNRINTKNASGSREGRGHGLLLVKERLELLLPNRYVLHITVEDGYYIVNFRIEQV